MNSKYNLNKVDQDMRFDEEIRRISERQTSPAERIHGRKLNEAGRNAYFEEYFNGVKLENQIIEPIGPFDDPRTTKSFQIGYERGPLLINMGLIPEKYQTIQNNKKAR